MLDIEDERTAADSGQRGQDHKCRIRRAGGAQRQSEAERRQNQQSSRNCDDIAAAAQRDKEGIGNTQCRASQSGNRDQRIEHRLVLGRVRIELKSKLLHLGGDN